MPVAWEGDSCPGSITIMDTKYLLQAFPSHRQHQAAPASDKYTVVLSQAVPVLVPPLHTDQTPEDLHTLLCTKRPLAPGAAVRRRKIRCLRDKWMPVWQIKPPPFPRASLALLPVTEVLHSRRNRNIWFNQEFPKVIGENKKNMNLQKTCLLCNLSLGARQCDIDLPWDA